MPSHIRSSYEITDLPALSLFQYTGHVEAQSEVPSVVGKLFARLLPALPQLGLPNDHPTLAWYTMTEHALSVAVGVDTTGASAAAAADAGLAAGHLDAAPGRS